MKIGILFKGQVISKEPLEVGTEKLKQLRATIDALGLKELPKDWRFLIGDDEQPLAAEDTVDASLFVVKGHISVGVASSDAATTEVSPSTVDGKPTTSSTGPDGEATARGAGSNTAGDSKQSSPDTKSDRTGSGAGKPEAGTKPKEGKAGRASARAGTIHGLKAPEALPDTTPALKDDDMETLQKIFGRATNVGTESSSTVNLTIGQVLKTTYEKRRFPATFRFDDRLERVVGAVKLAVDVKGSRITDSEVRSLANDLTVSLEDEGSFEFKGFERESFGKLFTSSSYSLAAASSVEGPMEGATVSASNSVKFDSKNGKGSAKRARTVHASSVRRIARARITLPKRLIQVTEDTAKELQAVLDGYLKDGAGEIDALMDGLEGKAVLVARGCTLGGLLFDSQQHEGVDDVSQVVTSIGAAFKNEVDASASGVGSGGVTTAGGASRSSTQTRQNSAKAIKFSFQAIGGDIGQAQSPAAWVASLANPGSWNVISVSDVLPIWEYLDEKQRRKWRDVEPELRSHLERLVMEEELKDKRVKTLLAAQAGCVESPTGSAEEHNVRREMGVLNLPGSVSGEPIHVEADWGYLGRTRLEKLHVPDGHVITYVRIWTSYDPPGTYKITGGGVLSNHMSIVFEQENLRNMSWHIDYQTARPDDINVSKSYPRWKALALALSKAK